MYSYVNLLYDLCWILIRKYIYIIDFPGELKIQINCVRIKTTECILGIWYLEYSIK